MHKNHLKIIKAVFKYLFLPALCLFFTIISIACFLHFIPNNLKVKSLLTKLEQLTAPEGSKKIDDFTFVGWVAGSGSGCDMIAGILYEFSKPAVAEEYFTGKQIEGLEAWYNVDVKVINLKDYEKSTGNMPEPYFENEKVIEKILSLKNDCPTENSCYFVYVEDTSTWTSDIRCY